MPEETYKYVIVGAGLAGGSAVEGIRDRDLEGEILLLGAEEYLPYDRPPLTKKLWFGKKKVQDVFLHDEAWYKGLDVTVKPNCRVTGIDPAAKTVTLIDGRSYGYEKLLLATGADPRRLAVPGAELDGISYYRTLGDYKWVKHRATAHATALVIGGGFIGSELAAALDINKVSVTVIFPTPYLCDRVFPEYLARAVEADYRKRDVDILTPDQPVSFLREGEGFAARTQTGRRIAADIVIVGIGVVPSTELASKAGLAVDNGIVVNELLQTSNPDIYAAGDNANFPYKALGARRRIEHWDNAAVQGRHAGSNMAGAGEPYEHMPYFFSDLFDFGYEAVGDVDSRLDTFADWQEENRKGVVYYLADGRVRGVLTCNIYEKLDAAREIIRKGRKMTPEDLRGAIK